jgi:hypothetical protein
LEKTRAVKEEYKALFDKEQVMLETKEIIIDEFKTLWSNLDTHGSYKISTFTVNNKGKYPIVGALVEMDGDKKVYYIKGYYKDMFLRAFNAKEQGYMYIPYNGMELVCLPLGRTFIKFNTNGITSYNGYSFAKI